jgi:hypothetical protein
METSPPELSQEEITCIERKINGALDIDQFEEAEKWVRRLQVAGVDCENMERKIAAFRHPEPYQGRFSWDSPSLKTRLTLRFVAKILSAFLLFILLVFLQMLVFSPYCHDPESTSDFMALSVDNTYLLCGGLLLLFACSLIPKIYRSQKIKRYLK